ncbi:hypothetical protein ExPUPEC61_03720 [Escherichia coli]|nr:hypothetical protein ExPUPEC61_03720 [Escherichia coli]
MQLGQQQSAATNTFGIANRRNSDINGLPARVHRRQCGAHRHRGDVFHLRVDFIRQLHAKLAQHIGDGLVGEFDLVFITGTVEADHQAVADQLVFTHTLYVDQRLQRLRQRHARQRQAHGDNCGLYPVLHCTLRH